MAEYGPVWRAYLDHLWDKFASTPGLHEPTGEEPLAALDRFKPGADVRKLSLIVPISAEVLADSELRWREPTPAERAQYAARAAERRGLLRHRLTRHEEIVEAGGTLGKLAAMHGPHFGYATDHPPVTPRYTTPHCEGCEFAGYEAEAPDWPCETWCVIEEATRARDPGVV